MCRRRKGMKGKVSVAFVLCFGGKEAASVIGGGGNSKVRRGKW